jgi:diguanylate cyclase (GGDEF)-like protein
MSFNLVDARDVVPRTLPTRALVISLIALAVPVVSALAIPTLAGDEYGLLIWLLALVPAFLLTYYRGFRGATLAVAGAMVALSLSQVLLQLFGLAVPNWGWIFLVVTNFLVITIGITIFAELLHRERRYAEALALADQLTGLPNRRHVELALDREFGAALRGRKLAVVMYDIDHFKQFNDTHGHAVGDDVLRTFGDVLQKYTRRQNVSGRYGGEEFISVVSDVDSEGVMIFAERVREAIRNTELPWGTVSVSGGVALYSEGMGSREVLVAAADRALYAAKAAGRDRVELAKDDAWVPERPSAPRVSAAQSRHRVLVVDAEPEVRESIVVLLKEQGYITEEAGGAQEANRLVSDAKEPFDVLITSVTMPRTSGFTLVDGITADTPDLRVIYMSESLRERVSWPGVPGVVHRFLEKPIDRDVLLETLKDAINEDVTTE